MSKCNNLTKEQLIDLLDVYGSCEILLDRKIEHLTHEMCILTERYENAIEQFGKENCAEYLEENNTLYGTANRKLAEFKTIKEKYFASK